MFLARVRMLPKDPGHSCSDVGALRLSVHSTDSQKRPAGSESHATWPRARMYGYTGQYFQVQ